MKLFQKIGSQRAAPGLERQIWRLLPVAALASVLGPVGIAVGARLLSEGSAADISKATATADIFAIAAATTLLTAVFTVGVGCVIVMIMKGPAYVADGYELRDADRPRRDSERAIMRADESRDDDRIP